MKHPTNIHCIRCSGKLDRKYYCNDCDISHFTKEYETKFSYAIKNIQPYEIEWSQEHTFIMHVFPLLDHVVGQRLIKVFDGYKLFDIKTAKQLEKLLILI